MTRKSKGVVRGAPSGLVISLLVHAAAFMLAGLLVVFTVTQKEEKKFVPPKAVERPKMKLKKPKVKVKKSAKPKPTTRIVTKVKRASMPDIQLPEMSGLADGLIGGIGGFEIMPDFSETTIFGSGQTIGNDFVGTFYDFKRDRRGKSMIMDTGTFTDEVAKFVRSGFKVSKLARYYRSPRKLYATSFMVPTVRSSVAPAAFGEADTGGWCWMAHYKGQLVHKDGIKFRFWGQGDDILIVRVDGKVVLNGSWPNYQEIYSNWQTSDSKNRTYTMGNNTAVVGDWITLEPGVPLDMEVVCGEVPGGHFDMMLVVQEDGVDYEKNFQNGPVLPMFKTTQPNHDLQDQIFETLVEGEASATNGPVFCDFSSKGSSLHTEAENMLTEPVAEEEDAMRLWTSVAGKTFDAEYISFIGGKAVLKSSRGKQIKLDMNQLSEADREYIEFLNPPEFDISFTKQSSQRIIETTPYLEEAAPQIFDWTFGVKLKQTSATQYNHELNIELFAFGQQYLDDNKFILLDRQTTTFVPTKENKRTHIFRSPQTVETKKYDLHAQTHGRKYKGYLVLVRDARGVIIQHAASNDWLYDNREKVAKVPVGRYLDETGNRVHPTGPKRYY
ncbi:SHD1 domain-containing protein [Pontiella sulfatireligans]|uniref:SHD1 domain-containing protein n=1 Tax=Pontiella sulfatireligans TaxID=2750658 RepID=UPI001443A5B7|nr:SHD1 domain-containing protein [Pontiella sulfatireligans]